MKEEMSILLRYAGALVLLFASSYLVLPFLVNTSFWVEQTLKIFTEVSMEGNVLNVQGAEFIFVPECAAVLAYVLLGILVLTTRGISIKKGLFLFLSGSILILVANIIRIDALISIFLTKGIDYFNTLHLFLWKIVSSIYVVFVWLFLTKKYKIKGIPLYSDIVWARKNLSR